MNSNRVRSIVTSALLLVAAAGTAVTFTACTYTDPAGREHTLSPVRSTPTGTPRDGWRVLSRFTDPDTGEQYELIDTNGDGKVDLIRRVDDGRLLQPREPFEPIPVTTPQQPATPAEPGKSSAQTLTSPSGHPENGPGGGADNFRVVRIGTFQWLLNYVRTGFAENDALTAGWERFDFGSQTARQWLDSLGLNVEAGTTISSDNIRMPVVQYTGGADGYNEVVIMWSGAFDMPTISARGLDYRMDTRIDPDGTTFVVIRAHGSATQVVRALAEIGSETFGYDGEHGERWSYVRNGDQCDVSVNGTFVWSVTLD